MKEETITELSNEYAKGFTFKQLGNLGKIAVMLKRINILESQLKEVKEENKKLKNIIIKTHDIMMTFDEQRAFEYLSNHIGLSDKPK